MIQLLYPILLKTIAAIAIPVIIHLWNTREGRILQVGSISLLKESATQQARSLRLNDILLLLLRCLLIIILAFLLAKPTWQKRVSATGKKGWIMVEKQSLEEAYKFFKPTIDSLLRVGFEFHYFTKGFKQEKFQDALNAHDDHNIETEVPYWALLKQLNAQLPAELPVYLFTGNKLKRFTGTRPEVSLNLQWNTYTASNTSLKSLTKAYKTGKDSFRIILSNSKPSATFYTFEKIAGNNNRFKFNNTNGKIFISATDTKFLHTIEADTSTLAITIYTDRFHIGANYVKAAIDAIQEYTGLPIKTSGTNNINNIDPSADWLFWLSDEALPRHKPPSNIFVYENGKDEVTNTWITSVNGTRLTAPPPHLSRYIPNSMVTNNGFEILWKDGFGRALLTAENTNKHIYHFYSRFDPAWNDLPWSTQFVEMIFDLLVKPGNDVKDYDNRIIDKAQLQPVILKKETFDKSQLLEKTDLSKLLWIIAFIIFCIERYISLYRNKPGAYA